MTAVRAALHRAAAGLDLSEAEAAGAMVEILQGRSTPALTAALLVALRMKGETAAEITGCARAMRASARTVIPSRTPARSLVDTCGTGGDGGATFNISTAAALVVAGAGLSVAKHGNRSVSSKCGSADVLEELGVSVGLDAAQAAECIDTVGIGFLFAPAMHPAMRFAGPVRQQLRLRTVFNALGPLTNPAGAGVQVVGVYEERLVALAAAALARLGASRALVVHGSDGMDEITVTGSTRCAAVRDGRVSEFELSPEDFGLTASPASSLAGGTASRNAEVLRTVLAGGRGAARDVVVVNSAAAIRTAGLAAGWRAAAAAAERSIDSGAAASKLKQLAALSQRLAARR